MNNYNELLSKSRFFKKQQQPINSYPAYKKSLTYPKDIVEDQFPIAAITAHAQAWGIPNTSEIDDLPLRMTDDQLQAVVIMVWRQYILHDEILAAKSFLEKAPFNVRDSKTTQDALTITNKMIEWLHNPSLVQKYNAPENPDIEVDVPMPYPLRDNQSGGRFNFVINRLPPQKVSIVDFGCLDGCFTNRFGLMGHEVYGLDIVETSVNLANKKAIEFNTGAKHIKTYFQDINDQVPQNYFDYATCTDTYEHLIDPVKDLFLPAKKLLKSNGKLLVCTPYGAWMRGNFIPWAHPWLWSKENLSWLCTNPRWHLIAPSAWSVIKDLKSAGFYVKDCYPVLCNPADVKNQGNIIAEASVQHPLNYPKSNIALIINNKKEWTPINPPTDNSEIKALEMANALSMSGNIVKVFNNCGIHGEGIYNGVEYHYVNKYSHNVNYDVVYKL